MVTFVGDNHIVAIQTVNISSHEEWKYKNGDAVNSLKELERGMVLKGLFSGKEFIISANYKEYCFGVRTISIDNLHGWNIMVIS